MLMVSLFDQAVKPPRCPRGLRRLGHLCTSLETPWRRKLRRPGLVDGSRRSMHLVSVASVRPDTMREGARYPGASPQSGTFITSPSRRADLWAVTPAARYLAASQAFTVGCRRLVTDSTNSWTRYA